METPVAEDLRATETEEADPPEKERVSAPATSTTTIVLSKTTLSRRKKLLQMFFSTILSLLWCALVRVFGQLISGSFRIAHFSKEPQQAAASPDSSGEPSSSGTMKGDKNEIS
ncbi:uncharacterized protein LOC133928716 isoform X2 [Phragmites australis]|uniref:uncharacterized protein LOC133928716 isoform X2 n=1 Tax=Phragmites australis TaxID=29695 RepID=UPI002D77F9CC|nr:uncharacterized protein LOC133928716 isoform X2 [Phragmites australis]